MAFWLALGVIAGVAIGVFAARALSLGSDRPTNVNLPDAADGADRRIAEAVKSLPIGLVLTDENGKVIYRNDYANSFEEGPRVAKALVRGHVADLVGSALAGEQDRREVDLFGPPRLRLAFSGRPLIEEGRLVGASVMISDITEEHRIDKVRRDFVANVSHELKTPIGAMSLLAETLIESTEPETTARLADRIHTAALRLGHTVDDLLSLSTIESGETIEFLPVEVIDLVTSALDACQEEAVGRSLHIKGPTDYNNEIFVLGDRPQLLSAINNLITNAIKYSDEGGEVAVKVITDDEWVEIAVIDRGIGIPEPDRERIFERFYRVDNARSRKTGGTGLGLSIVRHVAINHGGDVAVSSEEGKGSEFAIKLPIAGGSS